MAVGDSFRGPFLNERFETSPVRLQVGPFHLDRAGVIRQKLEEHLSEDSHRLVAVRRTHEVDPLEPIAPEVVEPLGPHAIPKIMMAGGDQGQLEPAVPAPVLRLRLERDRVDLL